MLTFYEDEVAQLNASLEVADLETKIMVDGKATREWDIDYWVGQMKSMMHTTPAVTLKLWDYAMNYVEATSAVKRTRIGHLRHASILQNFERTRGWSGRYVLELK